MKYVILVKALDDEPEEGEVKSRYGIIPPKPKWKKKKGKKRVLPWTSQK